MKVFFAPRALRDVDGILFHISQSSPIGARNVSRAIDQAIELCGLFPRTGGTTDVGNLYRRPLSSYPYTIFYRWAATDNIVEIVRVVHGARVKNLRQLPN